MGSLDCFFFFFLAPAFDAVPGPGTTNVLLPLRGILLVHCFHLYQYRLPKPLNVSNGPRTAPVRPLAHRGARTVRRGTGRVSPYKYMRFLKRGVRVRIWVSRQPKYNWRIPRLYIIFWRGGTTLNSLKELLHITHYEK